MSIEDEIKAAVSQTGASFTHHQTNPLDVTSRPRLAAVGSDPSKVEGIGAGMVQKRLEELLARLHEVEKQASALANQLAGQERLNPGHGLKGRASDTVFGRQLLALDEVGQVVENIARAVSRGATALT